MDLKEERLRQCAMVFRQNTLFIPIPNYLISGDADK